MSDYDSRPETQEHIGTVRGLVLGVAGDLTHRAHKHDRTKLFSPEVEIFDRVTPRLKETTYGSPEYKGYLKTMGKALDHHYAHNDHHPEHFKGSGDKPTYLCEECGSLHPNLEGIQAMNLIQLTEMLCDWIAATRRHKDGDIHESIDQNAERFGYGEELTRILHNTVDAILQGEMPT